MKTQRTELRFILKLFDLFQPLLIPDSFTTPLERRSLPDPTPAQVGTAVFNHGSLHSGVASEKAARLTERRRRVSRALLGTVTAVGLKNYIYIYIFL